MEPTNICIQTNSFTYENFHRPGLYPDMLDASNRLWRLANQDTIEGKIVAKFLLAVYDGNRFPFNLNNFKLLSSKVYDDCILILHLDKSRFMNICSYFEILPDEIESLSGGLAIT